MSTIDSGLGWSCDSDYYVSDANTLIGWGTQYDSHYYKTAAGGALAAKIRFDDGFNSTVLMSTVEVYSKMTVSPTGTSTTYPYQRDGVTWYVTVPPYAVRGDGSPSDYPWIRYDDPFDGNAGWEAQIGDIVEAMISEANVQYTVDLIPTTNWVKTFVEGVEAETATRVNALLNMIAPTFNVLNSYSVNDIVVYNFKLYKCITAHSGAWDSSHFTETTISQLFN